jgi:hypothetical protein
MFSDDGQSLESFSPEVVWPEQSSRSSRRAGPLPSHPSPYRR